MSNDEVGTAGLSIDAKFALDRYERARKRGDRALAVLLALFAALSFGAFIYADQKVSPLFWVCSAPLALLVLFAAVRLVLRIFLWRDILRDPWDD